MTGDIERLRLQSYAVHGFIEWLTSTLPGQSAEFKEFNTNLLRVLDTYERELDRQLEGHQVEQYWCDHVALSAMLVPLLIDELLETHPELAAYRVVDEPTTVHEMSLRLLSEAATAFERGQGDMSGYLDVPTFPGTLNGFMQSILDAPANL